MLRRLALILLILACCVCASIAQEYKFTGSDNNGLIASGSSALKFTTTSQTYYVVRAHDSALCTAAFAACIPAAQVASVIEAYAQQNVTLAAPIATPNAVRAEVEMIHKERKPTPRIVAEVWLLDAGGNQIGAPIRDEHTGAAAASLLLTLNAVARTKSEDQMILEHMQNAAAHGGVAPIPAGAVSGTPN
jgi:DNA-binding IclR family transcriptional regulator